jgi:hypothetical protein
MEWHLVVHADYVHNHLLVVWLFSRSLGRIVPVDL